MSKETKNELRLLHLRLDAELRDPIDLAKAASTIGALWQIVQDELAMIPQNPFQVLRYIRGE